MKLRSHLILLLVVTALPLCFFGGLTLYLEGQHEKNAVTLGLQDTSEALAAAVDREVEATVSALQGLALSQYLDTDDHRALYERAKRLRGIHPTWRTVVLIAADGQEIFTLLRPLGTPLPNVADNPDFVAVVRAARPYVSDLLVGPVSGEPIIRVHVPVMRDGRLRYIVMATIGPDSFADLLGRHARGKDLLATLVDRHGLIVVRTREPGRWVGRPIRPDNLRRIRSAPHGSFLATTVDGEKRVTAFSRVPGCDFVVVVGLPKPPDVPAHLWWLVAGSVLTIVVALLLALWSARRIVTPIRALSRHAASLLSDTVLPSGPRSSVEEVAVVQDALAEAARTRQEKAAEHAERMAADAARREAEASAQLVERIATITESGLRHVSIDELMEDLLARLRTGLGADTATILLTTNDGAALQARASDGLREEVDARLRVPLGHGIAGRVAATGDTVIVEDVPAAAVASPFLASLVKSLVAAPLRLGDRVIGVIEVGSVEHRRFTDGDVTFVRLAADRSALMIDRARVYEAERRARAEAEAAERRSAFLAGASSVLAASLDYDQTIREVADLAVSEIADGCAVDIVQADGVLDRVAVAEREPAPDGGLREMRAQPAEDPAHPTLAALHTGRTQIREVGPTRRSCVGVPLRARGAVLGVLTLCAARRYTAADITLAEELARRAAQAIDRARLYRDIEAASRSKDEFLAMLGHELRNPLGAVASAIAILNHPAAQEAHRDLARGVITRQARHLNRLLDDLLDVGRVTTGKIVLKPEPLDLARVVRRAHETLVTAHRTDRHRVEVDVGPVWVDADEARIEQIVTNLLANAIRYTPPGGTIRLRVRADGERAEIVVEDTGLGIEPDLLPRIFDLFVQGERAADRAQGGLGIGLTLVKRLAELHGGGAAAFSDGPGTGSRFVVWLPRIPAPAPSERPVAAPPGPIPSTARRRVVVVEDHHDAREMIEEMLRLEGHEVHVAADGRAGLEEAARVRPDVVLVDLGLPDIDGCDLARRLRADHGDALLLVAITGYGRAEDRERTKAAGFNAYLVKPVERDLMLRIVACRELTAAAVVPVTPP